MPCAEPGSEIIANMIAGALFQRACYAPGRTKEEHGRAKQQVADACLQVISVARRRSVYQYTKQEPYGAEAAQGGIDGSFCLHVNGMININQKNAKFFGLLLKVSGGLSFSEENPAEKQRGV